MDFQLAKKENIKVICKLYEVLFHDLAVLQPDYCKEGLISERFVEKTIEREDADILLAVEKEEILGFALFWEDKTPPYDCVVPYRFVYLSDIVVSPKARGKQVGTKLIERVKEWGKERKLAYVELNVVEENPKARALYKREGFETTNHIMKCKI